MAKRGTENPTVSSKPGDAASVAARVQAIDQIIQVRGLLERDPIAPPGSIDVRLEEPAARAELHEGNLVAVMVQMGMELVASSPSDTAPDAGAEKTGDAGARLARVEAAFVIVYQLSSGEAPAAEDLQAFAIANGVFNVNPFWREYLFSSLTRAGLPAFLAPVVKVGPEARPPAATPGP